MTAPLELPDQFFYIRHGQTEANRQRLISGHEETPLSPNGQQAAQEEAIRVRSLLPDNLRVFSSPLSRAIHTAQIVFGRYDEIVEELTEWNVGEWTWLSNDSPEGLHLSHYTDDPDGGETRQDFSDRALRAVHTCYTKSNEVPFVCVAHAGLGRALQNALGMEISKFENSILYRFSRQGGSWIKQRVE